MTHYLKGALLLLLSSGVAVNAALPITTWHNSTVTNVVDQDVIWKKNITLPVGMTTIHAVTGDISIYMPHGVDFFASDDGASSLVLIADAGRTIRIYGDESVTFNCSCLNQNPISFRWSGAGQVLFFIMPEND